MKVLQKEVGFTADHVVTNAREQLIERSGLSDVVDGNVLRELFLLASVGWTARAHDAHLVQDPGGTSRLERNQERRSGLWPIGFHQRSASNVTKSVSMKRERHHN